MPLPPTITADELAAVVAAGHAKRDAAALMLAWLDSDTAACDTLEQLTDADDYNPDALVLALCWLGQHMADTRTVTDRYAHAELERLAQRA